MLELPFSSCDLYHMDWASSVMPTTPRSFPQNLDVCQLPHPGHHESSYFQTCITITRTLDISLVHAGLDWLFFYMIVSSIVSVTTATHLKRWQTLGWIQPNPSAAAHLSKQWPHPISESPSYLDPTSLTVQPRNTGYLKWYYFSCPCQISDWSACCIQWCIVTE